MKRKKINPAIRATWPKEKQDKYDRVLAELDAEMEPRLKAIRDCERITTEDLKIIINAR